MALMAICKLLAFIEGNNCAQIQNKLFYINLTGCQAYPGQVWPPKPSWQKPRLGTAGGKNYSLKLQLIFSNDKTHEQALKPVCCHPEPKAKGLSSCLKTGFHVILNVV